MDNLETIGFFTPDRERFLEHDLTKLVYTLSSPRKKVVGLMSGLPIEAQPPSPMTGNRPVPAWMIVGQIKEFWEIKSVAQDAKEIPAEIETLIIVQPSDLKPETAYAIDQFALKGGRILAFIDPVAEVGRMFARGRDVPQSAELNKLLDAWGIQYDGNKVAADITHARRVQYGGGGGGGNPSVTEYVAWLNLDRRNLDTGDAISHGIETINIASPGSIALAPNATVKMQTLLSTSERAAQIDASAVTLRPDPVTLLREYKPGGSRLAIAARITGDIKTAFPDGPPPPMPEKADDDAKKSEAGATDKIDENKEAAKPPLPAGHIGAGRLNAIVIADTDMLHDQFWVDVREFLGQSVTIPQAHNAVFVTSALEGLAGGDALTSLRHAA